jgi:hypothetical protein
MGLCSSHYQQKVRGLQLTPLRQRPAEPLVTLGLRVPRLVRAAASADPAGARAALLAWVTARQPLAPVNKAKSTKEKPAALRWLHCARCKAARKEPRTVPPGVCTVLDFRTGKACGGGLVLGKK